MRVRRQTPVAQPKAKPHFRARRIQLPELPRRAVAEGAILAALFFCPLALGTVPAWAIAVMLGLASLALGWLVATEPTNLLPLPLLGVALGAVALYLGLQCLPLPSFLLRLISPQSAGLYAFSLAGLRTASALHPLSLDAPATGREFAKAVAYAAAFFAAYQLGSSRRVRRRLTAAIALAGLTVATIGYAHRLLGLGQLFGRSIYASATPRLVTTFGNSNNTAGLLVLCAPIALGLALRARDSGKSLLWTLAYLLIGAAVFLTLSRGGIVAFVFGQALLGGLLWRNRETEGPQGSQSAQEPRRTARPLRQLIGAGVAFVAILSVAVYLAYQPIVERYRDFSSVRETTHTGKIVGFVRSLEIIRDFPLTGIGRGAFPTVSARYLPFAQTAEYVENEPLQLAVDLGVPLAVAFLLILAAALLPFQLRTDLGPVECALGAGLLSLGLQNLADFSLELGGVALPATVALAVLTRTPTLANEPRGWLSPRMLLGVLALALPLSAWALVRSVPDWRAETDAFAAFAPYASGPQAEQAAAPALARHPASYIVPLAVADRYLHDGSPRLALSWANRALYLKRNLAAGHLIAATALAQLGRKPQALVEARLYFGASRGDLAALEALARFYPAFDDLRAGVDESGPGLLALANFLLARHRTGDATRAAELAVLAAPDDAQVHDQASTLFSATTQFDEAAIEAQRGIELAPDDSGGYLALETAAAALGNYEQARAALQRGLRARPGQSDLVLALVRLELAQGNPQLAETSLQQLGPQVGGEQRAQLFALQGEIYAREGRTVKAEEAYRNAARLAPGYTWNLVAVLESESKLSAAQRLLQELRTNAPENERAEIDARIAQEQTRLEGLDEKANARAILGNTGTSPAP